LPQHDRSYQKVFGGTQLGSGRNHRNIDEQQVTEGIQQNPQNQGLS